MEGVFMATKRKDVIRLLGQGLSQNEVCSALRCSKRDVSAMARFLKETSLQDEALADLSEADLRQLATNAEERESDYMQPDWDYLAQELTRPGMTRKLLWYEYGNTTVPEGKQLYQYSQFSALISANSAISSATARIIHKPGRTVFVDWAGGTLAIKDRITGSIATVYLFVACLPSSDYFYVEGFLDLTQRSWIADHIHAFEYFGGVPVVVTPDRCATAVDRTPIYVTKINETYNDFIEYYGAAVLPTRSARPRDYLRNQIIFNPRKTSWQNR